jgi:hypothetical protein
VRLHAGAAGPDRQAHDRDNGEATNSVAHPSLASTLGYPMLQIQTVHVAGIPVWIDAGWLLVFALIAWSLDDGPESRVA